MAKSYDKDGGSSGSSLQDIYLLHGINLTRYSNYEARKLQGILDEANKQIKALIIKAKGIETKAKYRRVSAEIKRISDELSRQLIGQVKLDFSELAKAETVFVEKSMRTIGLTANFELPAPAKVWAAASFSKYAADGRETFETYLNGLSENFYKTWDIHVRAGYLSGLTAQQINRTVLGSAKNTDAGQMQVLRRSLELNTRTMIAGMTEEARDSTYRANSRLFSGYRYLGTLDTRTCPVCGSLDGKVFKTLEEAPKLPAHHNCRCLYLPVIKGMEEPLEGDERASMDGPVPAGMTYSEWLKTQPEEVQRDILGPARFSLYKSGMPIKSFAPDGKTLNLQQLAEKEGISVAMPKHTDSNIPAMKIDRGSIDYSNLSYNQTIHEEAKWLNRHSAERGNEFASLMAHDNRVLGTWEGVGNSINISGNDIRDATRGINTYDFIHSHLNGTFFSDKDMYSMCKNSKLDKMMIAMPDNSVYYLKVKPYGHRFNEKTLNFAWNYNETISRQEIKAKYNTTELLQKQYEEVTMRIVEKMAYNFGWEFGKI